MDHVETVIALTTSLPQIVAHLVAPTGPCAQGSDVLSMLGRRWSAAVLVAAAGGARRFRDYRRTVTGVSDKLLSQRLSELEGLGLIEREVIPSHPVQIHHVVTRSGQELVAALLPVIDWGARNASGHSPSAAVSSS